MRNIYTFDVYKGNYAVMGTVELPVQRFSGKANLLVFPIFEASGKISVNVNGELFNCCAEMVQRSASEIRKKKSEIKVEEVLHRVRPKM